MKSQLFSINWADAIKGFILAVISALVTGVYQAIQTGGISFTWAFWQPIVYISLSAGLSYLIKNFLTNGSDKFLSAEPK